MNWQAIVAAVVSIGSAASLAAGHPALASVFSDPSTAAELTAIVGGAAAVVSAFSGAVHKPT